MLARDLIRAGEAAGHDVIALGRRDLDVTDRRAVSERIAGERPDAVVNCAAYTDVDGAESDAASAMRLNAEAAGHVAEAAARAGASVLYPSSDYVFDGRKGEPYVESDPTGPLSAYGRSKLAGERATEAANPRSFVVRSAWLFGAGGRNFVETMLRVAGTRGELAVVADQVGCPTYTGHLARALVRLLATDAHGVHHLAGAGACSWYEFAAEIFRRAGVACRVVPTTTEALARPAPRPAYSVLAIERADGPGPLPHWTEGLDAYLAERAPREAAA